MRWGQLRTLWLLESAVQWGMGRGREEKEEEEEEAQKAWIQAQSSATSYLRDLEEAAYQVGPKVSISKNGWALDYLVIPLRLTEMNLANTVWNCFLEHTPQQWK